MERAAGDGKGQEGLASVGCEPMLLDRTGRRYNGEYMNNNLH